MAHNEGECRCTAGWNLMRGTDTCGDWEFPHRIKAEIVAVGSFDPVNGQPAGWTFDGHGQGIGVEWLEDGSILYGGYSVEELQQVVQSGEYLS